MSFVASLRKEIMEQWRSRRLLVVAVVLVFFGLSSPLLAKYTPQMMTLVPGGEAFVGLIPEPTMLDAVAQLIKNLSQFGLLLAVLITMGAVSQEKDRGTAAMMLVKPVSRGGFVLAKFVAISLTFLISILVGAAGAYYYTVILFGAPDAGAWALATLLLWLEVEVYIAITLLFSTYFRAQAAAAGAAAGVIFLFMLLGISPVIARWLPARLQAWSASLFTPASEAAWGALGVSLVLIAACLVAAWLNFRQQEL